MNSDSREVILQSIREHLVASIAYEQDAPLHVPSQTASLSPNGSETSAISNIELFKKNLEAVNGHCTVARTELEIIHALTRIVTELKQTPLNPRRLALSDAAGLERLVRLIAVEVDEVTTGPTASNLFEVDIGITTAQGAIAETGTLILDSSRERNRLISLVPPVHIAIVNASDIYATLGEALSVLHNDKQKVSSIITFVTGPSRTADIELTLTIGVHGPQELYVIINDGPPVA
jgi:L-lactate dehydrogenase complex protein LldG